MRIKSYYTTACPTCELKAQYTTGKERRVRRWEHEGVLDAMQHRLNNHAGENEAATLYRRTCLRNVEVLDGFSTLPDEEDEERENRDEFARPVLQPPASDQPAGGPGNPASNTAGGRLRGSPSLYVWMLIRTPPRAFRKTPRRTQRSKNHHQDTCQIASTKYASESRFHTTSVECCQGSPNANANSIRDKAVRLRRLFSSIGGDS